MAATKARGSLTRAGRIPGATFVEDVEAAVPTRKPRTRKKATKAENQADPRDTTTTDPQEADSGKPAKTPKAAKTPKGDKKLSQIDAAAKLLTGRTKPMTCQQLVDLMAERKLWVSQAGKTPERTLSAALDREISSKGKESRFQKVAPGLYLLYGVKYTPAAE